MNSNPDRVSGKRYNGINNNLCKMHPFLAFQILYDMTITIDGHGLRNKVLYSTKLWWDKILINGQNYTI